MVTLEAAIIIKIMGVIITEVVDIITPIITRSLNLKAMETFKVAEVKVTNFFRIDLEASIRTLTTTSGISLCSITKPLSQLKIMRM